MSAAVGRHRPPALVDAVTAALEAFRNLALVPVALGDGRVEAMLRAALAAHPVPPGVPGVVPTRADAARAAAPAAVRAACAYLAATQLEDAYLALCTAADHLREYGTDRRPVGG